MDLIDWKIIEELSRDARAEEAHIGRACGVSGASVRRRIRRMSAEGAMRMSVITNAPKVGYETSSFIGIQVVPSDVLAVADKLSAHSDVQSVTLTDGRPFDILIRVAFRDITELANFINKALYTMPGIQRIETMVILREVKRSGVILEDGENRGRLIESAIAGGEERDQTHDGSGIDDLDYRLIMELSKDARKSSAAISRVLRTSNSTVARRLSRLLKERIIHLAPVAAPDKIGHGVAVNIGLQIDMSKRSLAVEMLTTIPSVQYLALTTGRYDLWLWATFKSLLELVDFQGHVLAIVPGIQRSEVLVDLAVKKRVPTIIPHMHNTDSNVRRGRGMSE